MQISFDTECVTRKIGEETVLLPVGESANLSAVFALNPVGDWIVAQLQQKQPIVFDSLLDRLVDTFSVDESQARTDLNAFLTEMKQHGLIRLDA